MPLKIMPQRDKEERQAGATGGTLRKAGGNPASVTTIEASSLQEEEADSTRCYTLVVRVSPKEQLRAVSEIQAAHCESCWEDVKSAVRASWVTEKLILERRNKCLTSPLCTIKNIPCMLERGESRCVAEEWTVSQREGR